MEPPLGAEHPSVRDRTSDAAERDALPDDEPAEALVRALAPRYRIRERIGRGGMGTVYRAQDLERSDTVAIKVFDPRYADIVSGARFVREIETLARLQHPHIVPFLDSGAAVNLRYYIMPHVDGGTLAERIARKGPLPPDEALQIVGDVAAALDYAHGEGVLHRDIKPQNILFSDGCAMVADFGLARAIQPEEVEGITPSDAIPGTPLYMSPEQSIGVRALDARSDQYSLACVAYEMFAGRPPFKNAPAEMLRALHGFAEPEPLSVAMPGAPTAATLAIQRALAKAPSDRFETAGAFAAALGGHDVAERMVAPSFAPAPPKHATRFIGRERELWECATLLDRARLVTVTGVGGAGKTRLALRLAERRRHAFPGGVWFVDLAPIDDPARVPNAVAAAVGVREEPASDLIPRIVGRLAPARALIVLDNCEHVAAAAAEMARTMVVSCGELSLIATSREPLKVADEHVYVLPPLALATEGAADPETIGRAEAVRLFVERAIAANPAFALGESNAATVAEVCRRLDGLPLAIELAATRAGMLSIHEILARLDDRFRLLSATHRDVEPRHRTLRAAIDWSVEQLSAGERAFLNALAVFRGGWTLEAAGAVHASRGDALDVLDGLARLADLSLLVIDRGDERESRYRFLETVREYALEHLEASGESAAVRDRHLAHFAAMAEAAADGIWRGDDVRWLARLDKDHDNCLAALAWAARSPTGGPPSLRLASGLYRFWSIRGHYETAARWLDSALAHPGAQTPDDLRGDALFAAAGIEFFRGRNAAARERYLECLAIFRRPDSPRGPARALVGLGTLESSEGRYANARVCYEESLRIYRRHGEERGTMAVLSNLGGLALYEGRLEEAAARLEEALALARAHNSSHWKAQILPTLGFLYARLGRSKSSCEVIAESLRLALDLGSVLTAPDALESAAELAHRSGEDMLAAKWFGASEGLLAGAGASRGIRYQQLVSESIDRIRVCLGPQRFAEASNEGRGWSLVGACRSALDWLERERSSDATDERGREK